MSAEEIAARIAKHVALNPGASIADLVTAFTCTCGALRIEDYSEGFTRALTQDRSIRLDHGRRVWPAAVER